MDLWEQKQWFDSWEFREKFHCDMPLGAFCQSGQTVFRLWAPTAERVALYLYAEGHEGAAMEMAEPVCTDRGLWVYATDRDLDGIYYDYEVTVDGVTRRTADPYARACGLNGTRSMVIDLRRTDPDGWREERAPALTPEQVIYELHVKDFSWDAAGGFAEEDRGRYSALCRTGTTLNGDGVHPTGLDYLKRLGVTHIQLMPVCDFGSVDEAGSDTQYNWGYDPVNYNVPEGSYSSDPARGEVRIRELKQAVQTLHQNGFRVIMDVVYNHTFELESWLWRTVPWYYYRQKEDGSAANGSGCGSELATERSMCARYILDSVLYWAEEYHMDGFRFDLMGLMDMELLHSIRRALDERYGSGEKLIYGEPWWAEAPAVRQDIMMCTKDNLRHLNAEIGAFCDATRDAVKGGLMNCEDRGFVNGGGVTPGRLYHCAVGWAAGDQAYHRTPAQTVNYLSCHDDWTLWDKLVYTMDPERRFEKLQPVILRANRMAASVCFWCQGRIFFLAGEEFGRTKGGVKNSYCSSPEINRLDWSRAWDNRDLVEHYRGLIALRMQLPALLDKSAQAARRFVSTEEPVHNCVTMLADNTGGQSRWDMLLLICNCGDCRRDIRLPDGVWQLLVDESSAFRWQVPSGYTDVMTVPPMSAFILGRTSETIN